MWNPRCVWDLKKMFFVTPFFRLLVREASPYLSCSLSITMRNVESRPARGGLRTRVLPVCDNKRKEPRWGRESEEEGSGAEWSGEDDGDTEGGRRGEETASKRKRKALSTKNEVKRGSRKKRRVRKGEENIKDIVRGTLCKEWEGTGRRRKEEGEKRSDTPKRRRRRRSSAKGEVVKMKMIEKMKR